jgi:L-malate glycosyltransferase
MNILFTGTFLSEKTGSKSVAEKLIEYMKSEDDAMIILVSKKSNPIFRAIDIFWTTLFGKFDVANVSVFSGKAFYYAWLAGHILYWRKKPFSITLHGGRLAEFTPNARWRIRTLFAKAARIQTPSLFLQFFFKNEGWSVEYQPNPIDLSRFTPPLPSNTRQPYALLWVRAFSEIYHPEICIWTLLDLLSEYPEATLTMVGPDKGILNRIKNLIEELGLVEKVKIVGPISNHNLPIYYQTHAVYLNTTAYESFGMALAEAAACGIPIVSSNVGEIPYLWQHESNILLVERLDAKSFATQVRRVFEQPSLAKQLGENAAKRAQDFDFQKILLRWKSMFKSLLALKDEKH